jgi:predicted nucleotidyltransferase
MADSTQKLSIEELSGVDETIQQTIERVIEFIEELAADYDKFDSHDFDITSKYVFGSLVDGTGVPNESDLDIALCVPYWHDIQDAYEEDHPLYRDTCDDINAMIRENSSELLKPINTDEITVIDLWIAEPEYNVSVLKEQTHRPVYTPELGIVNSERVASHIENDG